MSRFKEKEPVVQWAPKSSDTQILREAMKQFDVKVINGKKQYPFEQYCASKGIIGFTSKGQVEIKNATDWKNILKTWDLMKWQDAQDLEKLFNAFPEERMEYESKLEALRADIRLIFKPV